MNEIIQTKPYDLKNALSPNRLQGIWRIMPGYRLVYLGAIASMGLAALFKISTFLLLRYFVDEVLGQPEMNSMLVRVALGFIALGPGR